MEEIQSQLTEVEYIKILSEIAPKNFFPDDTLGKLPVYNLIKSFSQCERGEEGRESLRNKEIIPPIVKH